MLQSTGWLTLGLLPLMVFIFLLVRYLPAHDETITGIHRLYIVGDALLIATLGVLRRYPESSFLASLRNFVSRRYTSLAEALIVWIATPAFAYFVATIPDGALEQFWLENKIGRTLCQPIKVINPGRNSGREACRLTALLFEEAANNSRRPPPLVRNLVVTNINVVPETQWEPRGASYRFRERDFRYARFDGSDLHRVDFSRSDLSFASLESCDLGGANFSESVAEGADFSDSILKDASLYGLMLEGAIMQRADLQGTILGPKLRGGIFANASLDGSYLVGDATAADFSNSSLVAVQFAGTNPRLVGANFTGARLIGADFGESDLTTATLFEAVIWRTSIDKAKTVNAAFQGISLRRLTTEEATYLTPDAEREKRRPNPRLAEALDPKRAEAWEGTPEYLAWKGLAAAALTQDGDRVKTTESLVAIACMDEGDYAWVARAVLLRGSAVVGDVGERQLRFNGDPWRLHMGLRAPKCEGGMTAFALEPKAFDKLLDAVVVWKPPPT